MKIILLPGNSAKQEKWIEEVKRTLSQDYDDIEIQYYKHWQTGKDIIDLDHELEVLTEKVKDLTDYVVIGKSAGTLLALRGIFEKKIEPNKCVFMGLPIGWARNNHFKVDMWLADYVTPTLFIQNKFDPAASYEEVKNIIEISKVKNFQTVSLPGITHDYNDQGKLRELISEFISS